MPHHQTPNTAIPTKTHAESPKTHQGVTSQVGTFIGQQFGWRSTFWVITALGIVTFLGIQFLVQSSPAPKTAGLRSELLTRDTLVPWGL